MNILIPRSWLNDYVETNLDSKELADVLSLHAFSVERIHSTEDGDDIFEIEVTPNRGDALSVLGIARELRALLPMKGHSLTWKFVDSTEALPLASGIEQLPLSVEISDSTLVPRFSAVVLDNVSVDVAPREMRDRLEKVGIRAINNVVDVTNYLMIDRGQPMHAFDYDKILNSRMIVRESREGEVITTLDGVRRQLPAGVIVIEDGSGRLIDLCGIMGAENSEVDETTKRVLLFVQVYDPVRIRKASMALGHRTDAALRFEKGIDFEAVVPTLWEAVKLLQDTAGAKVASDLIDIVNTPYIPKKVPVDYGRISAIAGVDISPQQVKSTLTGLGFTFDATASVVTVPSWRHDDIDIVEDLAEEVIRIMGYYDLPDRLLTGEIPQKVQDPTFYWEDRAKDFLKYQGFFECYTASATSKELAGEGALELKNPLSADFHSFKQSLIPQLLDVVKSNRGYSKELRLFELGTVYRLPEEERTSGKLPDQPMMLGIVTRGVPYLDFKGIVEALLADLGVNDLSFDVKSHSDGVLSVELPFTTEILPRVSKTHTYTPLSKYSPIIEDVTLRLNKLLSKYPTYGELVDALRSLDDRIVSVEFVDLFEDRLTLRLEFLDRSKQLTSQDISKTRETILKKFVGVSA